MSRLPYRRRGIATALAPMVLRWCLHNGVEPRWDAANVSSCSLDEEVGYVPAWQNDVYALVG